MEATRTGGLGSLAIGVEDGTRRVRGVPKPLVLEERIANLISDSISPKLLPDIELLSYRKTNVLAVQVYPSGARPHFLTGVWPRVGPVALVVFYGVFSFFSIRALLA